jgi:hypothetical protein
LTPYCGIYGSFCRSIIEHAGLPTVIAMLDFLGIGAQKSGTTWLYENLRRHPAVRFPAGKEVHFWDQHLHQGSEWWLGLFNNAEPGHKQGEITPAYATLDEPVIHRVASLVPNVRLIYSIRNPIARAWSAALMALHRAEMTIGEASDQWFIDHFNSAGSRRRGDYLSCLDHWQAAFPIEQVCVLWFDDIRDNPKEALAIVARHIGADPDFFIALPDGELSQRIFAGPDHPLRPALYDYLRVIYAPSIVQLENRFDRDLSAWLAGPEPPQRQIGPDSDLPNTSAVPERALHSDVVSRRDWGITQR